MTVHRRAGFRFVSASIAAAVAGALAAAVPAPASAHEGHGHIMIFTEAPAGPWHDAAIAQGAPKLEVALEAEGMDATIVANSAGVFTDEGLAQYDAIVAFQTNGDPWTAEEKAAMERWMEAGHGIAAVHNATDMRGNYAWWDQMVGSLMPGHAPTGTDPGQPGTVRIEDHHHPSTDHFTETRWQRSDEWYNFSNNVRGTAHVLATMDETTYSGGNMGYDHPISWCKPYDGGRFWATALGHFPSHYDEPKFMQHLIGGVKYVAGLEPGDCGGTVWDSYERVPLDQNTSAPYAMDVAPDGKVFFTELVRGQIRVFDPKTQTTSTAVTIPVYSGGEDGLLGITLANDFAETGHLYIYYSPASSDDTDPENFFNVLSRLTYDHQTGTIDRATEKVLLEVPARRLPDEPGHTGGGLDMDADGNLYLGVGDDVNPHSEPSGGYAPLSERNGTFHDARATSANTNDLRGKLLRITPKPDGSGYTIPEGNLFPESEDTEDKTLPEIYAMGFRNPFRFSIDPETGWISLADYSPDNNNDAPATRGPAGIAEWNLIKTPGNYGWPLCMGNNEPFRDVDYGSTTPKNPPVVGGYFDCANPVNDSVHNTGLTELPPARPADMFYGYKRSSVPSVIPQGGGLAPMGGPFYHYDEELESDTKFPAAFDAKPFFYDWARNKMYNIQLKQDAGTANPGGAVEKVNPFLPQEQFLAPIDSKFGPDGSLYVLDWGGGYGRENPNSGLHRIDYIQGSRSPIARIEADPSSGQAPLTVELDGSASTDPEGAELTYEWDFEDDGTVDATGPTASHTYDSDGVHRARLTVIDPDGKEGTTTVSITVGNTEPSVEFNLPPDGAFFDFGDEVSWDVQVTDPEDEEISGDDVIVQPALGHDAHSHPTEPYTGLTGSVVTSLGGHAPDENIFFALDARYTDKGGEGGANPLTGSATTLLFPKLRQAEFFDAKSEDATVQDGRDAAGGGKVVLGDDGAWIRFDPVSFYRINRLALRASSANGGTLELRDGAADGELLATAEVPATGAGYRDVVVDTSALGEESRDLYIVFADGPVRLNFLEAIGRGASPTERPTVTITSPQEGVQLDPGTEVPVTADASDEGGEVTQVEFFVDGESIGVDDTAPFEVTWTTPEEENLYNLTAEATDDDGNKRTSRVVVAQVGELFGDLVQFTNANGSFDKTGSDAYEITGAGNNTWQSVDQYSALYLPGGGDDDTWEAVVKVNGQTHGNNSAKTGIMVRNDMTLPGQSPGYLFLAIRPANGVEFLRDTDGNGQLDASTAAGSTAYPTWLKVVRSGDQYTAYYSRNGSTWNQVGAPVTLAGAADTQDVGVATTAHSGTAGTARFEGFAVDSEVDPVDPEQTYEPLTCVGPLSDEFTGGLNGKWSVRQATGYPVRTAGGQLQLPVTGGDINEGSTGPVSFIGQPTPQGNWTATAKITVPHSSHWQWAGLVVHQNDDNYNKLAFVRHENGGRIVEFQSETNGARTTPHAPSVPADFPTTIYLRLTNTGGTLTAAYSSSGDDSSWINLNGSTALKPNARIGLMGAGDLGTTPVTASVDWFRVTPDREAPEFTADDEFDGDALDGCRWAHTVRYDAEHVDVAGGHLKVQTQPGDINGNNPVNPRNFVLQAAPEGDWVATTRFKAPLKHRWQLAGLLMYADDDNYAKADIVAYNNPGATLDLRAELAAESNGSGVAGGDQVNIADTTESGYWYLRVTKTGSQYTAEVSDDGAQWEPVGDGIAFNKPITSLGLMALGPDQEEPTTVEFDYFHLDTEGQEPEDTEAPTTGLTLDPADADGDNGWYVTAPSFTLTADDGEGSGVATTEYRIGGGAWTEYDGDPVTLGDATDGEVVVEYRSTDVAGNVEEAGSTTVKLDREGPETTAEVTEDGVAMVVTLLAEDAVSGVASTEIKVGDGAWTAYDEPVRIEEPGDYVVSFRSTDNAGNVEEAGSVDVTVEEPDTTAPITELTLDPAEADGDNGWYVTAPSFTLTADGGEGSDVEKTEYRIVDGEWIEYDGEPVALGDLTDGAIVVEYRSTDVEGNVEEVRSTTVKLDRAAPETTAEVTDDGAAKVVTLSAEDTASGVASTEIKIGDGEWTVYSDSVRIEQPGDHVVSFRSTDNAGHVEEAGTVEVTVAEPDTTGPELVVSGITAGQVLSHAARPKLAWTTTPTGSPVASVVARIDGRTVTAGRVPLWRVDLGRAVLTVTATDEAGNSTTVRRVFRVRTSIHIVRTLVQRFADEGSVPRKVEARLLGKLRQAQSLERRDRDQKAVAALRSARQIAGGIEVAAHRRVVKGDLGVIIRSLR